MPRPGHRIGVCRQRRRLDQACRKRLVVGLPAFSDFSGVTSMDYKRKLTSFGFDSILLESDGTFDGFDGGPVEGAFFGPAHQEVAGMFHKNDSRVIGSFSAVSRD